MLFVAHMDLSQTRALIKMDGVLLFPANNPKKWCLPKRDTPIHRPIFDPFGGYMCGQDVCIHGVFGIFS